MLNIKALENIALRLELLALAEYRNGGHVYMCPTVAHNPTAAFTTDERYGTMLWYNDAKGSTKIVHEKMLRPGKRPGEYHWIKEGLLHN